MSDEQNQEEPENPQENNRNILYSSYKFIDDATMYLANASVKTWNWTTGRTKADLASILQKTSAVSYGLGVFSYNIPLGIFSSIIALVGANHCVNHFIKFEKAEEKALEKKAKDIQVEDDRAFYKFQGYNWAVIPPFLATSMRMNQGLLYESLITTSIMTSASFHVMRADYLPPRKNCLARGLDNLTEQLQSLRRVPVQVKA
jgi:hypothetical protein